ncbi:MAG: ABC transporter permease [Candidatus Heimdallarchaeota archaeon]|nr:ABC transporter permease [Candidatus Heimdallarchaeota archaeon]
MRSPSAFANIFTFALPIALAATGAAFNERSGVINIGLEGIMLAGAFGGVYFTYLSGNPWIGALGAIAVGGFIGLVHAVLTISFKSEQIVTGVAINFLAAGITGLLTALIWREGASDLVEKMPTFNYLKVPVLGDALGLLSLENFSSIPLLGFVLSKFPDFIVVLNRQSYLFYLALLIIPICHILLFKTTIGLRIRTIGENPEAAATAGINVHLYQYASVIFSGMLCGLGGSMISLELGIFTPELTLGKGFYALAVMIFGKWTIIGSVLAAFLFGAFQTISIKLAVDSITSPVSGDVPPQFLQMVPNIFAILAVAGIIGRAYPPKSLGKPYDPSESE